MPCRPLLTDAIILKSTPQSGYLGYIFAIPADSLLHQ